MRNRLLRRRKDERGVAMITTLMVGSVLTAVGLAMTSVAVSNLQNAGRDRVAGGAMGAAEAGIAQAIAYIRDNGVGNLGCSPTCTTNPWGNSATPATVTLGDGREAKVYITTVQAFAPPAVKVGTYKVHSTGTTGEGPGKRTLEQTVTARPFTFPIGVYADTFENAGNAAVHTSHLFSKGCIINRNAISFGPSTDPETGVTSSTDPYYGLPPAAHAADYIITSNQASRCNSANSVHTPNDCNNTYRSDQDRAGGSVSSTACAGITMDNTSFFDLTSLANVGHVSRGLTDAQYAGLKSKAKSQGNYWNSSTIGSYVPPCPAAPCSGGRTPYPNAILYFEGPLPTLNTQIDSIVGYEKSQCGTRSLVIVAEQTSVHMNSNSSVTAALFVPDGNFQYNGGGTFEGTVFAKTVDKFNGNADFYLDACFIKNLPGGLFDVTPTHFREVDR